MKNLAIEHGWNPQTVPPPFHGRVAVVTGATSGVGKTIALDLYKHGADVLGLGRQTKFLEHLEENGHGRLVPIQVDLAEDGQVRGVSKRLMREFDGLDILVHGAAMFSMGRLEQAPAEEFDRLFRVNVRAPFLLTQELLPALKRRQGTIVFLNSTAGLRAKGDCGLYSATKHALRAVADSLREEVNEEGVRVLSVYLGRTATRMQREMHDIEGRRWRPEFLLQPVDISAMVLQALQSPATAECTDLMIRPARKMPQR